MTNLSQWFGNEAKCPLCSDDNADLQHIPGKGWEMRVDLGKQLVFPAEITQTTLRPDVVMWSTAAKTGTWAGLQPSTRWKSDAGA